MSIVIVGGKAGAKIAAEIFSLQGIKNILFAETYWEEKKGTQLTDDYKQVPQIIKDNDYAYFIATGDNNLRSEIYQFIFEHTGKQPINCIHPSAVISPSATLGFGNLICPLAVLHTESSIGNCAIINTGSIVEHDCVVKNFAQISPNVTLCGGVQVREYSFIGAGAVVIPNKLIGNKTTVAAGSVVIDYIPNNVLAAGVPAKIKKNNYQQ
jgi:sugar O-acyltransferase (sialic acid O-acetyltransferase NeuD family)